MNSYYDMLDQFMSYFDLYPHDVPNYPGYTCDALGNVYRPDGSRIIPFNSSGYKQVYMKDEDGKRTIKGVHQVVAMTFKPEEYYPGCVVHHKDETKDHNYAENLNVESRSDHSRHHADPSRLADWVAENGPVNKGKKMSDEFREKCRQSALNRTDGKNHGFHGNQYTNKEDK